MNAHRLLTLYEQMAEAPDAVPRLRRFVLDLAVRGKLVARDAGDEPALSALKRIKAVGASDGSFALPSSWAWVNVDSVANTRLGKMLDKAKNKGRPRPYLRNINVRWFDFDLSDLLEMAFEDSELEEFSLRRGDVLICEGGEPGRAAVWDERADGIYFQKAIHRVRFAKPVDPHFFLLCLKASADDGRLAEYFTGTGIKHFTGKGLRSYQFPLPPLAEQRRIVAKVEELMALLDRLEAARTAREATRDRLTAASLARLTASGAAPEEFPAHARFALDALSNLTARPDQIKSLRQTILNLAVRGKLVEQDPSDEPVRVSLAAISAKRDEMVRNKELRRERLTSALQENDAPFQIPSTWQWVRVGELALFTQYGTSAKAAPSETGIPVLTMGNIQDGRVVRTNEKRIPETSDEIPGLYLKNLDLLYNRTNSAELVGKTGLYRGQDDSLTFASYLIRIRLSTDETSPIYVNLAMNAPDFRETQIVPHIKKQTGQANVSGSALKDMLIPLPPLTEQHRIVTKVDALMVLCDRLEKALTTADTTRTRLLEAVLHEALSNPAAGWREVAE